MKAIFFGAVILLFALKSLDALPARAETRPTSRCQTIEKLRAAFETQADNQESADKSSSNRCLDQAVEENGIDQVKSCWKEKLQQRLDGLIEAAKIECLKKMVDRLAVDGLPYDADEIGSPRGALNQAIQCLCYQPIQIEDKENGMGPRPRAPLWEHLIDAVIDWIWEDLLG